MEGNNRILPIEIAEEMKKSYIDYSMSVIAVSYTHLSHIFLKSTSIKSYGILCSIALIASFIDSYALNKASLCLELVIIKLEEFFTLP